MRGSLFFTRVATTDVPEAELKASFEAEVDKGSENTLAFRPSNSTLFNASLRDSATKIVHDRRDRLFKARHVAASLGYPLQQRAGAHLDLCFSPGDRAEDRYERIAGAFRPEPTIAESEYQNILRIIENMSFVMERNPRVFSTAPEESIRDHYLVHSTANMKGPPQARPWNGIGKTDILCAAMATQIYSLRNARSGAAKGSSSTQSINCWAT